MEDKKLRKILQWCFIVCLTLTHVFVFQFHKIDFDYDFEKFFPENDPETAYFKDYRNKFESDNDFILIAIENKKGVKALPNTAERITKFIFLRGILNPINPIIGTLLKNAKLILSAPT